MSFAFFAVKSTAEFRVIEIDSGAIQPALIQSGKSQPKGVKVHREIPKIRGKQTREVTSNRKALTTKNAKNAEKNWDGSKELAAFFQSPDGSSLLNSLCDLCVLCG